MSLFEQLCLACRTGDADAAEKLLMAGANVGIMLLVDRRQYD